MEVERFQGGGGYDSGLGDEGGWGESDGCWAPPPSTAPSPEPPPDADLSTNTRRSLSWQSNPDVFISRSLSPSPAWQSAFSTIVPPSRQSDFSVGVPPRSPSPSHSLTWQSTPLETIYETKELDSQYRVERNNVTKKGNICKKYYVWSKVSFKKKLQVHDYDLFRTHIEKKQPSLQDIAKKFSSLKV